MKKVGYQVSFIFQPWFDKTFDCRWTGIRGERALYLDEVEICSLQQDTNQNKNHI